MFTKELQNEPMVNDEGYPAFLHEALETSSCQRVLHKS